MDRVAAMSAKLLQILSEKYMEGEKLVNLDFLIDLVLLHVAFIIFEYANFSNAKGWGIYLTGLSVIVLFMSTSSWRHSRWYSLFFCYLLWIPMGIWR